jgi:hypothetical protein
MKPDSKQVPQLVILGVLVLMCVGYVSFRVMGPGPTKHPKKPDSPPAESTAARPSDAMASVTQETGANSVFPDLARVPNRRDPFTPLALPGAIEEDSTRRANLKPRPTNLRSMGLGKLPRIDVKPINPFGGSGSPVSVPHPPADTAQQPKFTLTGVVRGTENVAILRVGDGGRYVVKQGQMIEGHYKVILVMSDAVVLSENGRRIYVRLGGEQNAS